MTENILVTRRRINAAVLLGIVVLTRPGCHSLSEPSGQLAEGQWGGDHMLIEIRGTVALVEFDCAHGRINTPILLDVGRFLAAGTFTQERGGPSFEDEQLPSRPARYGGTIAGDRMTVTVVLTDEPRTIGTYELQRGSGGRVFKCV